jgi:hypothetical protein
MGNGINLVEKFFGLFWSVMWSFLCGRFHFMDVYLGWNFPLFLAWVFVEFSFEIIAGKFRKKLESSRINFQ